MPASHASQSVTPAFGLLLPTREFVMTGRYHVRPLLDVAQAANAAGFESVWAGDSLLARPRVDPLTLLAAVAGCTESLALGTAVLLGSLRHPVPSAHAIASLDQLAEGRLILGLGAGFPYPATEAEFEATGVPFGERVGRLGETIRLWRELWSAEEPINFQSKYWNLRELLTLPRPYQAGGPRLLLAGEAENTLRKAGASVGGWLTYTPTRERFLQHWEKVQDAATQAGKADPVAGLYVTATLDDDRSRAERVLDEYLKAYYGVGAEVMGQLQALYAGPDDGFVEWLADYIQAGPRQIIIRMGVLRDFERALERVASAVDLLRRGRTAAADPRLPPKHGS